MNYLTSVVAAAWAIGFWFMPVVRAAPPAEGEGRYGWFGLLDHRSYYGQYWFPEPFQAPEMDVDDEARIDWIHTEKSGDVSDRVTAEVEKPIGQLTLEIEAPYERSTHRAFDVASGKSVHTREEGIGAIEVAARHPIFEVVSADERVDYTLAGALEVAVPTDSPLGKDWEVVPQLFNLLRIGQHFSVQASAGLSTLIGPQDGGKQTLEYAAVFGWALEESDVHVPGIARIVPEVELVGERGLNNGDQTNILTATAGVRLNLNPIGVVQPRVGIGYVFPIDQGAREEMNWGVVSSLVFEF